MELLYKCSYCDFTGTKLEVEKHENMEHDNLTPNNIEKLNNPVSVFFKTDFEMRRTNNVNSERYPIVYEIVKWYNTDHPVKCFSPEQNKEIEKTRFCFVVAFIRFDRKEWDWDFNCVGTRYIDNYVSGMTTWVKEWIEEFKNSKYPELEEE